MTDNTGPTDQRHSQPWTSSGNEEGNWKQGPFSNLHMTQPPCRQNKTAPQVTCLSSSLLSALPRGPSLCPIFSLSLQGSPMIHKAETILAAGRAGSSLHSSGLDTDQKACIIMWITNHPLGARTANLKSVNCIKLGRMGSSDPEPLKTHTSYSTS